MRTATRFRAAAGLVAAVTLVGNVAFAGPADDRFDDITGPFGEFVVEPADFGMDANRTLVDVPPLLTSVDKARAFQVLSDLSFPRTAGGPEQARQDARDIVTDELVDAGYTVQQQSVVLNGVDSPNLFVDLPGTECADRTIVIGAHYDSEDPQGGGSDDNASGVAGMLEIARALQANPLPVSVRFASWSYEEVGLVGASAMAKEMKADGVPVVGAISLEMIGYTEPDIDPLTGLPGTYLAMVSDPTSDEVAKAFAAAAYTFTPDFPALGAVIDPNVLPDILRSDHAAFLAQGYPMLLATDTANFRNPHYHQASDLPGTIDQDFLAGSTRAALAGLVTLGSIDQDQDGRADACTRDLTAPPSTTTTTGAQGPGTTVPATAGGADGADPVPGTPTFTG